MFPERLRALRKGQKITLKELAEHLNQNLGPNEKPNTASQIGNWERGIRTAGGAEQFGYDGRRFYDAHFKNPG